jgi:hypothetical protein
MIPEMSDPKALKVIGILSLKIAVLEERIAHLSAIPPTNLRPPSHIVKPESEQRPSSRGTERSQKIQGCLTQSQKNVIGRDHEGNNGNK